MTDLQTQAKATIKNLRDGVRPEGRMQGDVELFDVEAADEVMWEAADLIQALAAENEALRGALGEIVNLDETITFGEDHEYASAFVSADRIATAALQEQNP